MPRQKYKRRGYALVTFLRLEKRFTAPGSAIKRNDNRGGDVIVFIARRVRDLFSGPPRYKLQPSATVVCSPVEIITLLMLHRRERDERNLPQIRYQ